MTNKDTLFFPILTHLPLTYCNSLLLFVYSLYSLLGQNDKMYLIIWVKNNSLTIYDINVPLLKRYY
jgi:hypothetical protein